MVDQAAHDEPVAARESLARRGRSLAAATAVVYLISLLFPSVASLSKNTAAFPKWWGALDVGLAFVLSILVIVICALTQGKVDRQAADASYRAYRSLIHGLLVFGVMFMLAGDRIVWVNCVTGFAWRIWLLLYILPAWFTALGAPVGVNGSRMKPDQSNIIVDQRE